MKQLESAKEKRSLLIIGERINIKRKGIALATKAMDSKFIIKEASQQVEAGATMLDISSGTLLDEEPGYLKWLVQVVQGAVDVPLSLDSTNPKAISEALSVHKGKALLNSVSARAESFEAMSPLIRQYKCNVVALCLDDKGIPGTPEDRLNIASSLIIKLTDIGLPPSNIYLDPGLMPISVDNQQGKIALETIKNIKHCFEGVHTICGVSNISFGLPDRSRLNRGFMVLALAFGLDAVILDPCDTETMATLQTARTLLGEDDYCKDYIAAYRQGKLAK